MILVTTECMGCEKCMDICPVGAVTMDTYAEIDQDSCIQCGTCKDACPVEAIVEIHGNY